MVVHPLHFSRFHPSHQLLQEISDFRPKKNEKETYTTTMPAPTMPADSAPYEPCPILVKDFTEADVADSKEKLDALIV